MERDNTYWKTLYQGGNKQHLRFMDVQVYISEYQWFVEILKGCKYEQYMYLKCPSIFGEGCLYIKKAPFNTTYGHFTDVHKDFTTLSHQWLHQEGRQKIFNKLIKMG